MRIRSAAGALAIAALSLYACGKVTPSDKKTYIGRLPIYGAAELTVHSMPGTEEVVCAELKADLFNYNFMPTMVCDSTRDGRMNFDEARIPIPSGNTVRIFSGYREFPDAERAVTFALNRRGNFLQEVKETKK